MLYIELPVEVESALLDHTSTTSFVRRAMLYRAAIRGLNARQAAQTLGLPYEFCRRVYASPSFRKEVAAKVERMLAPTDQKLEKSLRERIADKAEEAFEVLVKLLEDESITPTLRARIAMDILDRNPESSQHSTLIINHEEAATALKAAQEMDRGLRRVK